MVTQAAGSILYLDGVSVTLRWNGEAIAFPDEASIEVVSQQPGLTNTTFGWSFVELRGSGPCRVRVTNLEGFAPTEWRDVQVRAGAVTEVVFDLTR